jgi:excisionase family DNA binding protein
MSRLPDPDCDDDAPTEEFAVSASLECEASGPVPPIMVVDELAALLRMNRKSVYEAIGRREIPGVRRIGRTFRISRDAVLKWLSDQGRVSRSSR